MMAAASEQQGRQVEFAQAAPMHRGFVWQPRQHM